jgi:hypothetical protein
VQLSISYLSDAGICLNIAKHIKKEEEREVPLPDIFAEKDKTYFVFKTLVDYM